MQKSATGKQHGDQSRDGAGGRKEKGEEIKYVSPGLVILTTAENI